MALDLEPLIADLRAQVALVWPETCAQGVWDSEHINMIAWKEIDLPTAVIMITGLNGTGRWGSDNLAFEANVQFFYVASTEGKAVSLRGKLMDLVNFFWPVDPLTEGQALFISRIDWSDELPPNQILRNSNRQQRAGMVEMLVLVGITQ